MKTMYRIIVCLLLTLSNEIAVCQHSKEPFLGKYVGWWADTKWTYSFLPDNIFRFTTTGHFGNTHTVGQYQIHGDTIIITGQIKELQGDSSFLAIVDTLLIDGDSCIIHPAVGYDYCKQAENEEVRHSRTRKPRKEFRKPDQQ